MAAADIYLIVYQKVPKIQTGICLAAAEQVK